jgi:5-methylcytosine-specific restriction endonuclease McrA
MSEEQQDTAQKFYDELGALSVKIMEAYGAVDQMGAEGAKNAVWRNSRLMDLKYADDLSSKVNELISIAIDDDGTALRASFSACGELSTIRVELNRLKERFSSLWNGKVKQIDQLSSTLKGEQSKVTQLTARLSEHAINSPTVREKVWAITDGKCFYCSIELTREKDFSEPHRCFHVDHIVPKSVGGPDHMSNYLPACERCNVSKNAKPFVEFYLKTFQASVPGLKVVGGSDVEEPF